MWLSIMTSLADPGVEAALKLTDELRCICPNHIKSPGNQRIGDRPGQVRFAGSHRPIKKQPFSAVSRSREALG